MQVQRGIRQFGGVCVHHGAGGASLQQPLPGGQQRDAAVVHVQPPGTRAAAWGGEISAALSGLLLVSNIFVFKQLVFTFSFLIFCQCVTSQARHMGIHSSLHMPDKVLNFVKDHFLMDSVIRSSPLLLKRSVRYTQIAVHKIQGMERAYDVLFIGTGSAGFPTETEHARTCVGFLSICCFCLLTLVDDGKLHKAINANDKMHIIEEMVLFPEPEPVQHIELDPRRVNHNCHSYLSCLSHICLQTNPTHFFPSWLTYKC